MSMFEKLIDPYEGFYSLSEALMYLEYWPLQFRGEDIEIADQYAELIDWHWWAAPFNYLRTLKPVRIKYSHPFTNQEMPLHKAFCFFDTEKKRILVKELKFGNYPAYGYAVPRGPKDVRQLIPQNLWAEGVDVDWDRSTVRNGSLAFESVKIIDAFDQAACDEFKAVGERPKAQTALR